MALKKVKLGDLLELCDERNSDLKYDLADVRGISIKKVFIDTKADMEGVSLIQRLTFLLQLPELKNYYQKMKALKCLNMECWQIT